MFGEEECECGLKHKKPCWKCPFSRGAPPLGEEGAQEVLMELDDEKTSCLDRDDGCVGALIFLRNTAVVPKDDHVAWARRQVHADLEGFFGSEKEFLEHHRRKS